MGMAMPELAGAGAAGSSPGADGGWQTNHPEMFIMSPCLPPVARGPVCYSGGVKAVSAGTSGCGVAAGGAAGGAV